VLTHLLLPWDPKIEGLTPWNLDKRAMSVYLEYHDEVEQGKSEETEMKTYVFRVVLEPDCWPNEPESACVWRAYIPILEAQGAATWGKTREEALKNIHEVLEMILEEFLEEGRPIPSGPESEIKVLDEPAISVAI